MNADLVSPTQNEYGFMNESKHRKMHEALAKANRMPVRQRDIRTLAMMFVIGQDERLRDAAKAAIQKLPATLLFECKEEAESANAQKYLAKEAGQWALLADPSYYRLYRTEDPEKLVVGFEDPEANKPETTARVTAAEESISWTNLAMTIEKILNDDPAASEFSLSEAMSKVKKVDVDAVLSTDADEPLIYDLRKHDPPTLYLPSTQYGDYMGWSDLIVQTTISPLALENPIRRIVSSLGHEYVSSVSTVEKISIALSIENGSLRCCRLFSAAWLCC
jgi:hypothetical protein